jgi:hypothetical protein
LWNHLIKREQMELAHSAERENGGSYSIPSFCQKTVEGCYKKLSNSAAVLAMFTPR